MHPLFSLAGIGKSIARKLAGQGLNVVLVALGDPLLDTTHKELSEQYPRVTFRKVHHAHGFASVCGAVVLMIPLQ